MPRTRKNKNSNQQVSNKITTDDEPSTSSQPPQARSSRRRSSPFRGFDDKVDQTNLSRLYHVLRSEGGDEEVSLDEALKDVPKEKRKRLSSPNNDKTKQRKLSKTVESKVKKVNVIDLFKTSIREKENKKKTQGQSIKKGEKTTGYVVCDSRARRIESTVVLSVLPSNGEAKSNDCQVFSGCATKGKNFVNIFNNFQRGEVKQSVFDEIVEHVEERIVRCYEVFLRADTTDLRVTALAWHPTKGHLLVSGGKAGTLILYKINSEGSYNFNPAMLNEFEGVGPGGTMENIKFNTKQSDLEVCTASVDGTVACYNFEPRTRRTLIASSDPYRVWFCAVDVHQDGKSVYGGDCMGNLAVHHLDSGKVDYGSKNNRLHTSKIRHLEFSPRDPNLMVTSSLDKTVKLWDIRKLDGKKSCLESLEHAMGVSAAKFSRTDGCRLLTTDLHSELRVYKAPLWRLEHKITHPHRHFQHLTVIRASWHSRADLFVVGRYPDPKLEHFHEFSDLRSVDVYSATTGKLREELTGTSKLITSLAEFNSTGNFLASSSGRTLYVWRAGKRFNDGCIGF